MGRARLPRGTCLTCGTPLERRIQRYCTVVCQQLYARRRYLEAWLAGRVSGMGTWANVSGHVRRYLFESYGACVICGWAERNPITGKVPLHIDHIDSDWRNDRPENLRLLCPNHHALTASKTFGRQAAHLDKSQSAELLVTDWPRNAATETPRHSWASAAFLGALNRGNGRPYHVVKSAPRGTTA